MKDLVGHEIDFGKLIEEKEELEREMFHAFGEKQPTLYRANPESAPMPTKKSTLKTHHSIIKEMEMER